MNKKDLQNLCDELLERCESWADITSMYEDALTYYKYALVTLTLINLVLLTYIIFTS